VLELLWKHRTAAEEDHQAKSVSAVEAEDIGLEIVRQQEPVIPEAAATFVMSTAILLVNAPIGTAHTAEAAVEAGAEAEAGALVEGAEVGAEAGARARARAGVAGAARGAAAGAPAPARAAAADLDPDPNPNPAPPLPRKTAAPALPALARTRRALPLTTNRPTATSHRHPSAARSPAPHEQPHFNSFLCFYLVCLVLKVFTAWINSSLGGGFSSGWLSCAGQPGFINWHCFCMC
jgi:hypothetical protein